jgi:uncharacterized phiE125 gp8 family phage protein
MTEPEIIIDAIEEPISLELARLHLRLDAFGDPPAHPDDPWLEQVGIPDARRSAEDFTGLSLAPKTYRLSLDAFPDGAIQLARPPLVRVEAIEYVDEQGIERTLSPAAYYLDTSQQMPWVMPAYGSNWPATALTANAVRVTYESGAATVQGPVKSAILLILGHLYRNREAVTDKQAAELPMGVQWLLRPSRVRLGMA